LTSVNSSFSITITKMWLKLGRPVEGVGVGVGDGLGLGVGDGDGEGEGVGDGEGDGDGEGEGLGAGALPAWKLATMPLAHAGVVSVWVAPYEPVALTTCALSTASLLGLVSCRLTRLKPAGAPQLCGPAPWLAPKPAKTISAPTLVGPLGFTVRLLTAVAPLVAEPLRSRLRLAPTSAMV